MANGKAQRHLRANGFWVVSVVYRRRVRVSLDGRVVYDLVDLVGSNARADRGGSNVENLAPQLDRDKHRDQKKRRSQKGCFWAAARRGRRLTWGA